MIKIKTNGVWLIKENEINETYHKKEKIKNKIK